MSLLPSGLDEHVEDTESLSRFLPSSSWIAKSTGRVKNPAFLPAPDDDTSVYRVTGLHDIEIWKIANDHFIDASGTPHKHHGAALVQAVEVRKAEIDAIAQEGPPRHANLRGWPKINDADLQKAKRKVIATKIADKATFLANS